MVFPEFSAQPAAANPTGSRGGAPRGAAEHSAAPLARLPLSFLPGPAGSLCSGGDGKRREAPRACGCLEMLGAAVSEGAGAGAGGRTDVM